MADQTIPDSGSSLPDDGASADLLDALLFSVAHDLKSPLLTLSLSAELITEAVQATDERARIALDALRHGTKDIERMLDAVTAVSRARRRPLDAAPVVLRELLAGATIAGLDELGTAAVAVDPRVVAELVEALSDGGPVQMQVTVDAGDVRLDAPLPAGCPECDGPPLAALLGSLQTYAGTAVATLAALQAQLQRQGGALTVLGGRAFVRLPLAKAAS